MDIVELLVLAAFILLPLIQGVLEKLGGARRRQPPPEWEMEEPSAREAERPAPAVTREAAAAETRADAELEHAGGWSAGWGHWPAEAQTLEDLSAEEVVSEEAAEEMVGRQVGLEDHLAVSEAARVTVPVVSLEPLDVERTPPDRTRKAVSRMPPSAAATVHRAARPVLPGLRTRSDLRQAIVLAEVLGPPRVMRPLEEEGRG